MSKLIFLNIGWMARYQGLKGQPDKIVGGGSYVKEHNTGHEVCNFFPCTDGKVYGHVETILGSKDRRILIDNWGGDGPSLSGVDIVWMATHPQKRGRRVVGWYRNATIFRERQKFDSPPSKQHRYDEVETYRVVSLAENAHLLDLDNRTLIMPKGKGWMGQTQWWSPSKNPPEEVIEFVQKVEKLLRDHSIQSQQQSISPNHESRTKTANAASSPYVRYIQQHELCVSPKHNQLQNNFQAFLYNQNVSNIETNLNSVDLCYQDPSQGYVLVEIKPCESSTARYAIRTAMGQLLDYKQRTNTNCSLLIVIATEPEKYDSDLATQNGFGIAYPSGSSFCVKWP